MFFNKNQLILNEIKYSSHTQQKPENLGFDIKGRIKLFDFGLAIELRSADMLKNGTYNIPKGGTLRYMAPEVAKKQSCNCSADVYSYGIMLWSVLALEIPFKDFTVEKHANMVVRQNYRPKIPSIWHSDLKSLLPKCWSENIAKRPTFADIEDTLDGLTSDFFHSKSSADGLGDFSFSSASFSFKKKLNH